ncbi:glycosyltransferase [Ruegeria arenilitoris]|uniref:glycosyltransferase n=1 Tax=Ruegeria arenilitoris TaxID=1173585 RepID=UPI00147E59B3|nr:glycosyltransferase family A protein [Ruegeria arenilitoris]
MGGRKVSVVIPTYRDTEGLLSTLDALSRQTYPAEFTEILCIDNTPNFELRDQAASLAPAQLLHEPRPGSYAARNRGIESATGEIFAFTDADCLPEPEWLAAGIAELEHHPDGALIAGNIRVFAEDPERPTPVEVLEILTAFPQERYAEKDHFGATANVFVPRCVIERAGPFTDTLASGGDNEFGNRVHAAGFPVVYGRSVVVRHPARQSLRALLAKTRRVVEGVHVLEKKGRLPAGLSRKAFYKDLRPPVLACWRLVKASGPGNVVRRIRASAALVIWRYYRAAYRLKVMVRSR